MQRVVAAHDALQFGELADHAGRQIGLREQHGAAERARYPAPGTCAREKSRRPAPCAAPCRARCRAWRGRRGRPRPRPGRRAAPCGPAPRRTGRRRGARAAPARCRRRSFSPDPASGCSRQTGTAAPACHPACRQEKYFWCVRIAVASTSGGNSMLAASIAPISTTGNSTSPVTSSSSPGSGLTLSPSLRREPVEIAGDQIAAAVLVEDDVGRFELFEIVGRVIDRDLALGQKAMPARRAADRHKAERQPQNLALKQADHRGQRPHPAQRGGRKAHRFRPGQLGDRGMQQLGQHLHGGAAGALRRPRNRIRRGRCRESRIARSTPARRRAKTRRSPVAARRRAARGAPRCGPAGARGSPRRSRSGGAASRSRA